MKSRGTWSRLKAKTNTCGLPHQQSWEISETLTNANHAFHGLAYWLPRGKWTSQKRLTNTVSDKRQEEDGGLVIVRAKNLGRYTEKGSGSHWFSFLKRATEYKCMDLYRGVYAADGKNRPGVMALTVSGREVRGYVGVSQRQKGKTQITWHQPWHQKRQIY